MIEIDIAMGETASSTYGETAIRDSRLEAWPNPSPDRDYTIEIVFPEFTCLCPRSGYPDFATIRISYIPDESIVELKSLKLYLNGYRQERVSHEGSVNRIFDDLKGLLKPRRLDVDGEFNPRGNVQTVIRISLGRDD